MPSSINEPLHLVLSKYDMEVLSIRNESYKDKKGVWWINTHKGYRILKKISNSEETLKYILTAVQHLRKSGINLPEVIKTKTGDEYVQVNGTCYVLSQAVEGKNPSYDVPEQLEAVVKALAGFHKASRGFSPIPGTKPKVHLGTWIQDYENQLEDMNGFYKKELESESRDEISKFIVSEFPAFYSRALKAIEGLKGNEYKTWVASTEKTGGLCHQDFAAGNLFINSSGKVYVIDTDSITIDIPARDLRKLLNKVMKKRGKWELELTKKILAYYQSINPLTVDQWKVVKLDIMFPHLFIGAMNKYCYKREKEWTNSNYSKRLKEVTVIEKTIIPILEKFETIIPK